MILNSCISWLISFAWDYSNCKERESRITNENFFPTVGFEPGTFRLEGRRATNCTTRSVIHNQEYFILYFSLALCSLQFGQTNLNEMIHDIIVDNALFCIKV